MEAHTHAGTHTHMQAHVHAGTHTQADTHTRVQAHTYGGSPPQAHPAGLFWPSAARIAGPAPPQALRTRRVC